MHSIPDIKANAGIYRAIFHDERVTFRLDRVSEDRHHSVSAEVTVMNSHPGLDAYIHQARLNLVSTAAQRTFAKYLREQCPALEHLEWDRMVGRVCLEVLRLHRQGEPVVDLATYEPGERVSMRVEPILQDRKDSVVFAYGGVGKTLICANYLGLLVASGVQSAGFTPEPGNVLLIDYETDPDESQERTKAVARGLGIEVPADRIFYRHAYQAIASDIEQLQRLVLEKDIVFVVVDSASPACGGEPESAEATTKYFMALRSLRLATLTLAHVPKVGDKNPFGSVFWTNLPRAVYKLTSDQKPGDSSFTLGLTQTKVNWGKRLHPIGLRVAFDGGAVTFEKVDIRDVPDLDKERSLRLRIRDALSMNGGMSVQEIADKLDVEVNQVRARLSEYRDKDFVIINPDDKTPHWGVLTHAEG